MLGGAAGCQCQASVTWRMENGEGLPATWGFGQPGCGQRVVAVLYVSNFSPLFVLELLFSTVSVTWIMRNGEWLPEIWAWVGPGLESRRSNLKHYFCSTAFFGVHWNWNDGQNQTLNFLSNFASVQEKFPLRCLMPGGTYIHLYFALELFLSQKTPD